MPVSIRGTAGGSVTLSSGAAATDTTLTLPNTTGTVALTASPTFSGTLTATTITSPASTALTIQSAGTTAMTVDTSQNVGIGTSSPGSKLSVTSGNNEGIVTTNGTQTTKLFNSTSITAGALWVTSNHALSLGTNNAEQMRIDASGNLLVGTTAANPVGGNVSGVTVSPAGFLNVQRSAGTSGSMAIGNDTVGTLMNFYYTGSGSAVNVGSIVITTTTSSFVGTSDYRLKEDIAPLTSGISTIAALKPISYKWKVDQSVGEGFIAHELGEVIPLALFGAKDALNEDGSIKPQGIDMTKIVPHLVAAIQELSAKNDSLEAANAAFEARLAALEAK